MLRLASRASARSLSVGLALAAPLASRAAVISRPLVSTAAASEVDELRSLVGDRTVGSLYDYEAKNAAGEAVAMSGYAGKAVLVVNVASL